MEKGGKMSENHGKIWWTELNTHNVDKAKDYYAHVLGWRFDETPMEGGIVYNVAMLGDTPVAGIFDISSMPEMAQVPDHWFTYVAVDDVDAAAASTEKLGGKIQRAPWDVAGVGRVAIVQDAAGAHLGLMTPTPEG